MNKAEFVDLVKEVGEFDTKKEAERAISAFATAVEKALAKKESIELVGFGKFETVLQKGKEGTVPGTTKKYKTQDKFVPKFKAGNQQIFSEASLPYRCSLCPKIFHRLIGQQAHLSVPVPCVGVALDAIVFDKLNLRHCMLHCAPRFADA